MIHQLTRMSGLVLAFGIFFTLSCSTLQNSETANTKKNKDQTIQQDLRDLNNKLSENPDNPDLLIDKIDLLSKYANTLSNPSDRKPLYQNIREISDRLSSNSDVSNQLDVRLNRSWRNEQQSGITLLQQDDSNRLEDISRITSHFENGITLIPDSLQTYKLLATTHYKHGSLNKAIETLKMAENRESLFDPDISEKLAYLLLESGDMPEAENRYRELVEFEPDKLIYRHGLINVLILSDQHEEAISMLEELTEEYPTRYTYQESLAAEMYYLFRDRTETLTNIGSDSTVSSEEQKELADLLNSIHGIFESLKKSLPTSEENLYRMAAFYKKSSERLSQLPDSDNNLDEMEQNFMKYSLPAWERLVEINPDNLEYITNLYEVYLDLGMNDDAESIERSYNF